MRDPSGRVCPEEKGGSQLRSPPACREVDLRNQHCPRLPPTRVQPALAKPLQHAMGERSQKEAHSGQSVVDAAHSAVQDTPDP